jgi:ParB family chromosome partitioning protein
MPDILRLPLERIEPDALPRDRTGLDPAPFDELVASIRADGLRAPVEVFALPAARDGGPRYGLVSGLRRLWAFRRLRDEGAAGFDAIPAFLRDLTPAEAFRAMVAENELRANLSPWERARAARLAVEAGFHPTVEAAVDALHPAADRRRRARLRAMAMVVEELDGLWTAPERIPQADMLALADALRAGFGPPIAEALRVAEGAPHPRQWEAVRPYLAEHEAERARPPDPPHPPGRPRRLARLRPGLTLRRERTAAGYTLRFSGPDATSPLLDAVIDAIERLFG